MPIEERVGTLEAQVAAQGVKIGHIETIATETQQGVKTLLERDAARPSPMTGKAIIATLLTTGALVGMVYVAAWWMVSISPAVKRLDERLTELDHPRMGRVPVVERKIETLEGWAPRVSRR